MHAPIFDSQSKFHILYRRYLNSLSNRTPPKANSNTTPVKNPVLGQTFVKIGQIVAKFELNPIQKSILKNRTP